MNEKLKATKIQIDQNLTDIYIVITSTKKNC